MRVKIENLGVIKQADFEVGDLTIICGDNNTGKTYVNYALYGFLDYWNYFLDNIDCIKTGTRDELRAMDSRNEVSFADGSFNDICRNY